MNRLTFMQPEWATTVTIFVEEYPEFKPYLYLAPLNCVEPIPYENVNTLFEAIVHYICAVGVRYDYAIKQWKYIYPFINTDNWTTIIENVDSFRVDVKIQNKKREIYYNLCQFMNENNLTHKNLTTTHLKMLQKNVKGVGDGCVAWCKKYFTFDDDCVEYTDINFKKGFAKVYGVETLSLRKKKAIEWQQKKFGRIGSLMVLQIGHYA